MAKRIQFTLNVVYQDEGVSVVRYNKDIADLLEQAAKKIRHSRSTAGTLNTGPAQVVYGNTFR